MWVVEVEEREITLGSGTVRELYGPFSTIQEAREHAEFQQGNSKRWEVKMIKPLKPVSDMKQVTPQTFIQTSIQDHIGSISDAHL